MKLDTGTKLVLTVLLAAPALWFVPTTLGFWCAFYFFLDVFNEAGERHDREER
jgi:hypothetical protein